MIRRWRSPMPLAGESIAAKIAVDRSSWLDPAAQAGLDHA